MMKIELKKIPNYIHKKTIEYDYKIFFIQEKKKSYWFQERLKELL